MTSQTKNKTRSLLIIVTFFLASPYPALPTHRKRTGLALSKTKRKEAISAPENTRNKLARRKRIRNVLIATSAACSVIAFAVAIKAVRKPKIPAPAISSHATITQQVPPNQSKPSAMQKYIPSQVDEERARKPFLDLITDARQCLNQLAIEWRETLTVGDKETWGKSVRIKIITDNINKVQNMIYEEQEQERQAQFLVDKARGSALQVAKDALNLTAGSKNAEGIKLLEEIKKILEHAQALAEKGLTNSPIFVESTKITPLLDSLNNVQANLDHIIFYRNKRRIEAALDEAKQAVGNSRSWLPW